MSTQPFSDTLLHVAETRRKEFFNFRDTQTDEAAYVKSKDKFLEDFFSESLVPEINEPDIINRAALFYKEYASVIDPILSFPVTPDPAVEKLFLALGKQHNFLIETSETPLQEIINSKYEDYVMYTRSKLLKFYIAFAERFTEEERSRYSTPETVFQQLIGDLQENIKNPREPIIIQPKDTEKLLELIESNRSNKGIAAVCAAYNLVPLENIFIPKSKRPYYYRDKGLEEIYGYIFKDGKSLKNLIERTEAPGADDEFAILLANYKTANPKVPIDLLLTPTQELPLNTKGKNLLRLTHARCLGEAAVKTEADLLAYRNAGKGTVAAIAELFASPEINWPLGTPLPDDIKILIDAKFKKK